MNQLTFLLKKIFVFFFFPLLLYAFEPHRVTPYPVVGFKEIPLDGEAQTSRRHILVWYPVDAQVGGVPSDNPWDLFNVAVNAPPAQLPEKFPLIVISHGYLGNPHNLSWLIRNLVYHRFVVIGIRHMDLIEGQVHANHWQRAQDIKIILDQFLSNPFAEFIDRKKIGIAGYSLGGTTAVWVAGGRFKKLESLIPGSGFASSIADFARLNGALLNLDQEMMSKDWREPRIKAAFIMAPAWSWLFDEKSLTQISIPVYLIAAEADQVVATQNNAGFFARYIPHNIYQTISGKAGHYIFISALNGQQRSKIASNTPVDFLFLDDRFVDRSWIQYQVSEEAVKFFNAAF